MKHLFVLGCHRSGTTMLQQALNRHSQIVIPPETKYFSWFLGHSHRTQLHRLERINRDLQINLPPPARRVRGKQNARQFFDDMARAYLARLDRSEVEYFGEKTPVHSGYVPQIRQVFPEAKFLWIYRDGRDVALSMRKTPFMDRDLAINFIIWLFYYCKQLRAQQDKTLQIQFVKYEDLVSQAKHEFERIMAFLGLELEPAVVQGHGNREGILDWEHSWKGQALKPISAERVGAWRSELTGREVELLEWLGGRALRKLGYELATARHNPLNVLHWPGLGMQLLRFFRRLPVGEVANQFLGRAVYFG